MRTINGTPTAILLLRIVWKILWRETPDEGVEEMTYHMASTPAGGRRLFCAPRGARKTACAMVVCLDRLDEEPNCTNMWLSAGGKLPADICRWHKDMMKAIPMLHHLLPGHGQRDGDYEFDVGPSTHERGKDPSLFSAGIGSAIAGRHPKHIYLDDIEQKTNSETVTQRRRLAFFTLEPENMSADIPGNTQIATQTPHCIDSVIHKYEQAGFEVFIWPQRFPNARSSYQIPKLFPSMRARIQADPTLADGGGLLGDLGKPTVPSRWNEERCQEKQRRSRSLLEYRLQQLIDTRIEGLARYPIRCAQFPVMELDGYVDRAPEKVESGSGLASCNIHDLPCLGHDGDGWYRPLKITGVPQPWGTKLLAIDPAEGGGDEIGYAVGGCTNSQIFVLEAGGLDGGWTEENLIRLALIACKWKVFYALVEDNSTDPNAGSFASRLFMPYLNKKAAENELSIGLRAEKVTSQKGKRIRTTLMKPCEMNRIILNRSLVESDANGKKPQLPDEEQLDFKLFFQLSHIEIEDDRLEQLPRNDRADAFEKLVRACLSHMGEDRDESIEKREELQRYRQQMQFTERARRRRGFGGGKSLLDYSEPFA